MKNNYIVEVVTKQINYYEDLIKQENDNEIKLYYYYSLCSLLKIRFSYTSEVYSAVRFSSNAKRIIQGFIIEKENTMTDTIDNSRQFLKGFSENMLDYINETRFCYENNNNFLIDDKNFSNIMEDMLKKEKIYQIYLENKDNEILDLNAFSNICGNGYDAAYFLISQAGRHLIVMKDSSKNLNGLLNYSHEYGHFLVDYSLGFDIKKTNCKNPSYNEIVSEILHMKLRRILLDNNCMNFEREKKGEYSFISNILILYIYSHYNIVGNRKHDKIVKQAIADIALIYPNIKIVIEDVSTDSIISAYIYGMATYIGSLYEIKNINVLKAKDICTNDGNNPLMSFSNIGLDNKNFTDSSTIKDNLSKILIRK